jgi:predicted nuclease with TOPRIM domain
MEITLEQIATAAGLVMIFAVGGVMYGELKMKMSALKEEIDEIRKQRERCYSLFNDIRTSLEQITNSNARTEQKLEDFIKWQKNGGRT